MDTSIYKYTICFTLMLALIHEGYALECYACDNQDSNRDKCIKTSIQCEEHHDACYTEIKWGLPPYWVPYGDRMHYVFKGCDTRVSCEYQKAKVMPKCKRDWYDDWSCMECCSGDLCNYYVTLGAGYLKASPLLLLSALTVTLYRLLVAIQ